jgi:hypothetical protein
MLSYTALVLSRVPRLHTAEGERRVLYIRQASAAGMAAAVGIEQERQARPARATARESRRQGRAEQSESQSIMYSPFLQVNIEGPELEAAVQAVLHRQASLLLQRGRAMQARQKAW